MGGRRWEKLEYLPFLASLFGGVGMKGAPRPETCDDSDVSGDAMTCATPCRLSESLLGEGLLLDSLLLEPLDEELLLELLDEELLLELLD